MRRGLLPVWLALFGTLFAATANADPQITQVPKQGIKKGDQFTLFLRPPVPPGCAIKIRINSYAAPSGDTVGDLKAIGVGATTTTPNTDPATTATFEATEDNPNAKVTFEWFCPPNAITPPQIASHNVGKGAPEAPSRPAIYPPENKGPPLPDPFGDDFAGSKSKK